MQYPNVTFVKFPEIDEVDKGLFEKALEHFFKKMGEDAKLHLTVKQYNRGGLRAQHEVKGTLTLGKKDYFATHEDWQLLETTQQVLKKLEKEAVKDASKAYK